MDTNHGTIYINDIFVLKKRGNLAIVLMNVDMQITWYCFTTQMPPLGPGSVEKTKYFL